MSIDRNIDRNIDMDIGLRGQSRSKPNRGAGAQARRLAIPLLAASAFALSACGTTPKVDPGAAEARSALTELQSNPELASRAAVAIRDAEAIVREAEVPREDPADAEHRAYLAKQEVAVAAAQAQRRLTEDQLAELARQRDQVQIEARTAETEALRQQLAELNAKNTDRGLVLTLGDVLFESGKADLKAGATANLTQLVVFLTQNPERALVIEGHTDSVGSEETNLTLSQQRADAVRTYLVSQNISSARITALGRGEGFPIASNSDSGGRQQNRRVEIIIDNATAG